jgi:hypothetical protein
VSGSPTTACHRPSWRITMMRWPAKCTTGAGSVSGTSGKIAMPPGTGLACGSSCAWADETVSIRQMPVTKM